MIRNKQESDSLIKQLGLNRLSEEVFTQDNINDLPSFLESHPYPYYNLRDKANVGGKFLYKVTAEEIMKESIKYKKFSVYESLALADDGLILQGDIQLTKDFVLTGSLSDIKGISNRAAMQKPCYYVNMDLKENNTSSIRGLSTVIDYIVEHQLIEIIVEFSLFDVPVGINRENILIWELRNY